MARMTFKVGQIWAEQDEAGVYPYPVVRVEPNPLESGQDIAWLEGPEGTFYITQDDVDSGLFFLYQDVEETSECTGLPHLARRIRETVQSPSVAQADNQRLVSMALHRLADLIEGLE